MNNKDLLLMFEGLSSQQEEQRLTSCENLLNTIMTDPNQEFNQKSIFGKQISDDLDYTLKKLIKGSTTSNNKGQLSYAFCLQELIKKQSSIDQEKLLDFILKECNHKNAVKKSEVNHYIYSRILCIKAFLNQKSVFNYDLIYDQLLQINKTFKYFGDLCNKIIKQTLNQERITQLSKKIILKDCDLNTLSLVLIINKESKNYKQQAFQNFIAQKLKNLKPIIEEIIDQYPYQPKILKQIIRFLVKNDDDFKFQQLYQDFSKSDLKNINFKLQVFKEQVKTENLNDLDKEITQLWLQTQGVSNRYSKQICQEINKEIIKKIDQNNVFEFLKQIRQFNSFRFSSRNEIVQNIFKNLKQENHNKYYAYLKKKLLDSESLHSVKFYLNEIYVFAEINIQTIDEKLYFEIVDFVLEQANKQKIQQKIQQEIDQNQDEYSKDDQPDNREIQQTIEIFYENYFSLVNGLLKVDELKQGKSTKKLLRLLEFLSEKRFIQERDDIVKVLSKMDDQDKRVFWIQQFMIATALSSFQTKDNIQILQELNIIYQKMFKNKKIKGTQNISPIQVLVDIMIQQLTKSHYFLRDIIKNCFSAFVDEIDQESISNLVQMILRKNEEYINDMEEQEDEEDEEEEQEDKEEEQEDKEEEDEDDEEIEEEDEN